MCSVSSCKQQHGTYPFRKAGTREPRFSKTTALQKTTVTRLRALRKVTKPLVEAEGALKETAEAFPIYAGLSFLFFSLKSVRYRQEGTNTDVS